MTTPAGLRALGAWADRLESPDFVFGSWEESRLTDSGAWTMPYFTFSPDALAFLRDLGVGEFVSPKVDWMAWSQTEEAARLRTDPTAVANATPEDLQRLLTTVVRGNRFSEGTLPEAFETGLLARIARRAAVLAAEPEL